jgi:outer membrane protein OmpA-like peptidoglycan-associated protein
MLKMIPSLKLLTAALLICSVANAQTVGKRAKDRAVYNANNKTNQTIDKGVDSAFDKTGKAISNIFKKKDKTAKTKPASSDTTTSANTANTNNTGNANNTGNNNNPAQPSADKKPAASFSDFVPGTTIIFQDDFTQDALADFPAKWNSTGSGKVTSINGVNGRWLELADNTLVTPELTKALPEDCTIEFDLFLAAEEGKLTPYIQFGLSNSKNIIKQDVYYSEKFWVAIDSYNESNGYVLDYGVNLLDAIGNKRNFLLTSYINKVLHVSMSLNKTRLRVYLDETKIIDLPKIIAPEMRNTFYINNYPKSSTTGLFFSNVRIATAETDARSLLVKQLMEEGRAVTNDILFDVNSDVIKKTSYEIVNQFGEALKTNPALKIKITGHTDSDGNAASNLELSKKRAAAVKQYIIANYAIADARMQTDGKGASQPVASNGSTEGKAKNRRVEFVKL